ncbi:MAG: hypothetical protein R2862_00920 [Thermoanaerobaculia bacterium]
MRHDPEVVEIVPRRGVASIEASSEERRTPARRRHRLILAAVIALLAWGSWGIYSRWDAEQNSLLLRAESAGLAGEGLVAARTAARREFDPALARIEIARAILQRELLSDPTSPESFEHRALHANWRS